MKLFFTCFLYLTLAVAYSQFNRYEIGVESGPTITSLWGNDIVEGNEELYNEQWVLVAGYRVGGYFTYNFHENLGIQTGIFSESIDHKRYFFNVNNNYFNEKVDTVYQRFPMSFISFPLVAKIGFGGKLRFNFSLGGFFSYLVESRTVYSPMWNNNKDYEVSFETTKNYERFNTGLIFGAGIDYRFNNHLNIGFEIRDQLGWYNIEKGAVYMNQYLRTNALQFLFRFSYKFPPTTK